jgi:hypothetical protein
MHYRASIRALLEKQAKESRSKRDLPKEDEYDRVFDKLISKPSKRFSDKSVLKEMLDELHRQEEQYLPVGNQEEPSDGETLGSEDSDTSDEEEEEENNLTPIDESDSDSEDDLPPLKRTKAVKKTIEALLSDSSDNEEEDNMPPPPKKMTRAVTDKPSKAKKHLYKSLGHFLTYPQVKHLDHDSVINQLRKKNSNIDYIVAGKETHEDGGTHFHVFLKLRKGSNPMYVYNTTWDLQDIPSTYELAEEPQIAHGNYQSAKSYGAVQKYVSKDGDIKTFGDFDVEDYMLAKKGKKAMAGAAVIKYGLDEAVAKHPELIFDYEKLRRNEDAYKRSQARKAFVLEPPPSGWYCWQDETLDLVKGDPHPRRIHWFVDYDGAKGKSTLAKWLCINEGALQLEGRTENCLHALNGQRIVIFDLPRQKDKEYDYIYALIEKIKNGCYFSGKYMPELKVFPVPHVLVFSNWDPDTSMLSEDRWDVRTLNTDYDLGLPA